MVRTDVYVCVGGLPHEALLRTWVAHLPGLVQTRTFREGGRLTAFLTMRSEGEAAHAIEWVNTHLCGGHMCFAEHAYYNR